VFSVSVARIGQENVVAARTIDATSGQAKTTSHRVPAGTGEEVLALVGPVVAEVFPDVPLRANAVRGVATERARALNPPPLPTSVFWSAAGIAAAGLVSAASLGAGAAAVSSDLERKLAQSVEVPVSGRDIQSEHELGNGLASAAVVAAGVGVGVGLGAVVVALFTDFEGYGDAQ
jgi:hypothetical protein